MRTLRLDYIPSCHLPNFITLSLTTNFYITKTVRIVSSHLSNFTQSACDKTTQRVHVVQFLEFFCTYPTAKFCLLHVFSGRFIRYQEKNVDLKLE